MLAQVILLVLATFFQIKSSVLVMFVQVNLLALIMSVQIDLSVEIWFDKVSQLVMVTTVIEILLTQAMPY